MNLRARERSSCQGARARDREHCTPRSCGGGNGAEEIVNEIFVPFFFCLDVVSFYFYGARIAGAEARYCFAWKRERRPENIFAPNDGRGEVPAMLAAQPPSPSPSPEVAGEDESSCRGVFMEFMTKVTRFEKLAESGERLLGRFREELENFRRPPIPKESDVMNQILKSNCTVRMRSYIEAGCRLHCQNISNINQLSSCEDRLKDHIKKVKTLLEELECLVENVYGITLAASLSALEVSDSQCLDNMLSTDCCPVEGVSTQEEDKSADQLAQEEDKSAGQLGQEEDKSADQLGQEKDRSAGQLGQEEDKSADQLDTDVSFVTVMVMVRNMLKLDYMMQEKIVGALSLKTPSSELEAYCLMWNLRPYIDDDVMNLAWKMCP